MNLKQGLTLVHRKDSDIVGNLERYGDMYSVRYQVGERPTKSTPLVSAAEIVYNWKIFSEEDSTFRLEAEYQAHVKRSKSYEYSVKEEDLWT